MNKKIGRLSYNYGNDRFGIIDSMDLWADDGIHCGECLEILVNDKWQNDRIEMDRQGNWYFVECGLKGDEIEGTKVKY